MVILTKADLLDQELKKEYSKEMKFIFKSIPHLIISSVTKYQLIELKDVLWRLLNKKDV